MFLKMMKLSVQTAPILDNYGIDAGFGMIADAGFDCVDFNIDHCLPGGKIVRGELDSLPDLVAFADKLERATIETIEAGEMTGDLALITTLPNPVKLSTRDFILAVAKRLAA